MYLGKITSVSLVLLYITAVNAAGPAIVQLKKVDKPFNPVASCIAETEKK
jgi:hypothetical protein